MSYHVRFAQFWLVFPLAGEVQSDNKKKGKHQMKKTILWKWFGGAVNALTTAVVAFALSCSALAEEYNDGTYTWTYQISNGKAEIYKSATEAAVDPKPEDWLEIPSELDGYPVTRIGEGAFYGCSDLWDVEVPDSVTSIGDNAFYGCLSMSRVSLPRRFVDVLTKASPAFAGCSSLLEVGYREVVDDTIWQFLIDGGVAVLSNDSNPVIPTWTSGHVTVPSVLGGYSVAHIGPYAFAWCGSMTGVTIPDSVQDINMNAFMECTSLKAVTLPGSVTGVGQDAFSNCSALEIVSIPSSVTTIGANAFAGTALKELHVEPGSSATVEGMITTSGYTATLTTSEDLGVISSADVGGITWSYRIVDGTAEVFKGSGIPAIPDTTAGEITIPSELDGHPVTRIGESAFWYCDQLTGVTIPDGVTIIGVEAFYGCDAMTSVTIPYSVTRIEKLAFSDCYVLEDADIPYSVTSIADSAFSGCYALADAYGFVIIRGVLHCYAGDDSYVTVPANVTRIGDYAFYYMTSVYSVDIPASVTSVGDGAFMYCSDLASVTIPGSVASIGEDAFYECDNLSEVTIPAGVTSIGMSAFYDCDSLIDVWIPSTVTEIGANAFDACPLLANVHVESAAEETRVGALLTASGLSLGGITFKYDVPATFTATFDANGGTVSETSRTVASGDVLGALPTPTREGYTFHAWFNSFDESRATMLDILTSDEDFYARWIPAGYGVYVDDAGVEWTYKIDDDEVEIVSYDFGKPAIPDTTTDYVEVPEKIDGKPVTRIGDYAFYGCALLTEVDIPDGVTSIGVGAFEDCSYLDCMYLPDSVTSIGEWAFGKCAMLKDLPMSDSLTRIEDWAFYGCASLTEVYIPDSVATIGVGAFQNCYALASVDFPDELKTIGDGAFMNCILLEGVHIPEAVTEIGNTAFGSSGLTHVTIPGSVTHIGDYAFYDCASLTDVTISEGVETIGDHVFEDCVLLGTTGTVEIPATVTAIGARAFVGCSGLATISIPYSVTSIGDGAFYECGNLDHVDIPGGVTSIGSSTFAYCSTLTDVAIPASVTEIGEQAFYHCDNLASISIPKSVTSIGSAAFDDCTAWTTVYVEVGDTDRVKGIIEALSLSYVGKTYTESLPSEFTVTFDANGGTVSEASRDVASGAEIGELPEPTRDDCTFLGWFTEANGGVAVDGLAKATADVTFYAHWIEWKFRIEDGEAELCDDYDTVVPATTAGAIIVPGTLGGCPVTRIGDCAFENCAFLTSVTLPETVTEIGWGAFAGCTSLLSVTLPSGLTLIEGWAFAECPVLSISVPDGVEVEDGAFYGCDAMVDSDGFVIVGGILHYYAGSDAVVTVPDGVTAIGSEAFEDRDFLTSVTLPETVVYIGDWAFSGCPLLDMEIPDGVTEIGWRAFSGCSALAAADLPADLEYLSGYAFADCASLVAVEVPEGLASIPDYAFSGCSALTDVSIPATVTDVGTGAFTGCALLATIHVQPYDTDRVKALLESSGLDTTSLAFEEDLSEFRTWTDWDGVKWTYHICSDGAEVIAEIYNNGNPAIPATTVGDITLPDMLGGYPVKSIGDSAFYGCKQVTGVAMHDDLKYICQYAFAGSGVTSVAIPDSVKTIGSEAFSECGNLAAVTIPNGVTAIGESAFSCCTSLTDVEIPGSVVAIGDYAFDECTALANLTIGDGVEVIGEYAFNGCTSLEDIEIPGSVKSIGESAFDDCAALTSVTIGDGVEEIGDYAFLDCADLEAVELPASVTILGKGAFKGCLSLADVTLSSGLTELPGYAFADCTSMTEITIPTNVTTVGDDAFVGCSGLTVKAPWALKDTFTVPTDCTIEYYGAPTPPAPTTCMVVFDENCSDDVDVSESARTVPSGSAIGELPTATRAGWTLDGWYTAATGGTKVDASFVVTEDMYLYAHWTENGGGSGGDGDGEGGGPVDPEPEVEPVPCYEWLDITDITEPYSAPSAVVLHGAVYDGCDVVGIVELKLGKAKKGKSKIGGSVTLLNGKKYSIKAQTAPVDGVAPSVGYLPVKSLGMMHVAIGGTKFAGSLGGWHVQSASVCTAWSGKSATASVEMDDVSAFSGMVLAGLLPYSEVADVNNGKWKFKKAAGVKWGKPKKGAVPSEFYEPLSGKDLLVDDAKGKTNLSGMKLSYTPKKGTFKGSFKLYTLQGSGKKTKLKKYTVKVSGVVVDGVGYGIATCKKPAMTWAVTVTK